MRPCPHCAGTEKIGYRLDPAVTFSDAGAWPYIGDLAVCFTCEAILEYVSRQGQVQEAKLEDLSEGQRLKIAAFKAVIHRQKRNHNL